MVQPALKSVEARESQEGSGAGVRTETRGEDDGSNVIPIAGATAVGTEVITHGYGISYAGELPAIAVRQEVVLTDFNNRPA
jgi:hypothetical protein